MRYVDQLLVIVTFILHIILVYSKDYSRLDQRSDTNSSIPLKIYISYSHNPLGESRQVMLDNEKSKYSKLSNRSKRGAVQLYNMVVCATGCNPLQYKNYGCYCGFLGSGYPVDSIDRCCKMHDWCYDSANCPMFLEYFIPYVWTCYYNQPLCAGGWSCRNRLCECDRKLAECLRNYPCPKRKAVCTSSWRLFQNWRTLF